MTALALLGATKSAKADTINAGGVDYTLTQVGTGQVDLTVDTTHATISTPVLGSFSIQFTGATSATIDAGTSSDNIGTWAFFGKSPNNPGVSGNTACNSSSTNANFFCFDTTNPLAVGGAGDVYTFEFNVAGTDIAGTTSHIQFFQGTSLAVSQDIGVPEPSSLSMLGLGLLGLLGLGLARKRLAA